MLQLPASKFGSPDLELLVSDSTVNKVVQQIGGLTSPFSLELLVDGLSITLLLIPINHSPDEITFYGTISGTGLFSFHKTVFSSLGRFLCSQSSFPSFLLLDSFPLFFPPFIVNCVPWEEWDCLLLTSIS